MSAIWDKYKYGKENPFYDYPVQKAHYHPSSPLKLDSKTKEISLSPRQKEAGNNKENRDFLDKSNTYQFSKVGELGLIPTGDSVSFDESWPQSERPSSISIPEVENLTPLPEDYKQKSRSAMMDRDDILDFGDKKKEKTIKETILSKYVDRFRNSQPTSREDRERAKLTDLADFWWLKSPSYRTSSTDSLAPRKKRDTGTPSGKLKAKKDEADDKETRLLQEKTNRLLEGISNSSAGSLHPAVSTVGLGSDATSVATAASSFDEEPFKPGFIKNREPTTRMMRHHVFPEDDILYKWRMQRKREQARDRLTTDTGSRPFMNVPQSSQRPDAGSAFATFGRGRPEQGFHVDVATSPSLPLKATDTEEPKPTLTMRDAVMQTSTETDPHPVPPFMTFIPVACPHTLTSGGDSFFRSCCHGDHRRQANPPLEIVGRGKIPCSNFTYEVDDDDENENVAEKETKTKTKPRIKKDTKRETESTEITAKENETSRSSRPPKANRETRLNVKELSDTEAWQTTDKDETDFSVRRRGQKKHQGFDSFVDVVPSASDATEDRRDRRTTVARSSKTEKEVKFPPPRSQSSPTPIKSVIDQVICDRLFLTSGSLVSSLENFELSSLGVKDSVDVDVDDVEIPAHDRSKSGRALRVESPTAVDLESTICSDGEDFKDDDILFNLRQRRSLCLQRLRELDQLNQKT